MNFIFMGLSKLDLFTEKQIEIANICNSLSHPARIAILQELMKKNECVCGELVSEIGLSQSTISQHLKELKKFGLIKGSIDGAKTCYCIDYDVMTKYKFILNEFLNCESVPNFHFC